MSLNRLGFISDGHHVLMLIATFASDNKRVQPNSHHLHMKPSISGQLAELAGLEGGRVQSP